MRGRLFVCLNKMFYDHSLDVNESGSMYWPVHLYIHIKILEIRFLLRNLQFYMKPLKHRKKDLDSCHLEYPCVDIIFAYFVIYL